MKKRGFLLFLILLLIPISADASISVPAYHPDIFTNYIMRGPLSFGIYNGKAVLYDCAADAETVQVPASVGGYPVVFIGAGAFEDHPSLRSISLPDTLNHIEDRAFKGCAALRKISFGTGLVSIGSHAFYDCYNLTELSFPASLRTINISAFEHCQRLTSVTFHTTLLQVIPYYAFSGCSSLVSVSLPDGLLELQEGAFLRCSSLRDVQLPDSVQTVSPDAFKETPWQDADNPALLTAGSGLLLKYRGHSETATVPDGIRIICNGAFSGNPSLKKVILPDSVETIDEKAFWGCPILQEVHLPASATIAHDAFDGTPWLDHAPSRSVVSGGTLYCWRGQGSEAVIPGGVTRIAKHAFRLPEDSAHPAVTRVILPDSVTKIDQDAFDGCPALMEIQLPDHLSNLSPTVFQGCPFYDVFRLNGVVADGVLYSQDHTVLLRVPGPAETFTVPEGVQRLDNSCFAYTRGSLKSLSLPASLRDAGNALTRLPQLEQIDVAAGNPIYYSKDGVLFARETGTLLLYPSGRTEAQYSVPAGTRVLPENVFLGAGALREVVLPEGGIHAGKNAFRRTENALVLSAPADAALHEGGVGDLSCIIAPEGSQADRYAALYELPLRLEGSPRFRSYVTDQAYTLGSSHVTIYTIRDGLRDYVMLRDAAFAFSGTDYAFDVQWQGGRISCFSGVPYRGARPTVSFIPFYEPLWTETVPLQIFWDEKPLTLDACTIAGNYFVDRAALRTALGMEFDN